MKNHSNSNTALEKGVSIWYLLFPAALIIFTWLLYNPSYLHVMTDPIKKGAHGDSYGALNTLFSGLAFAVLIYTMMLQRQELKLQREELRDTREELRRSADAQNKMQDIMAEQLEKNYTASYVAALSSLHSSTLKKIELGTNHDSIVVDRAIADVYYEEMKAVVGANFKNQEFPVIE